MLGNGGALAGLQQVRAHARRVRAPLRKISTLRTVSRASTSVAGDAMSGDAVIAGVSTLDVTVDADCGILRRRSEAS